MKNGICYIAGAGGDYGFDFITKPDDMIIAADGGLAHLEKHGIKADLVIGDFDSLGRKPDHPNVITLDKEKDDTDTFAAAREGIRRGYRTFHLHGCTGGRLDHTIANIQLLAYLAENQLRGFLFDETCVLTVIKNGSLSFESNTKGNISIFSFSEKCRGVFERGLKYELSDAEITNTFPIGVSNEFIGMESIASVRDGVLLILFPRECRPEIACIVRDFQKE